MSLYWRRLQCQALHNSENNANGNILYRFLVDDNVAEFIHPNAYTCYRSRTNPSTIDLALAKGVDVASSGVTELNSDHCPVEYILKIDDGLSYETPVLHYMYKEADWDRFMDIVSSELGLGPLTDAKGVD